MYQRLFSPAPTQTAHGLGHFFQGAVLFSWIWIQFLTSRVCNYRCPFVLFGDEQVCSWGSWSSRCLLMKLLELTSGQNCHRLAQGHLMVLLNFCLEWHSPGPYSIVINVCVALSRLLWMCVTLLLCCSSGTFRRIVCFGFPKIPTHVYRHPGHWTSKLPLDSIKTAYEVLSETSSLCFVSKTGVPLYEQSIASWQARVHASVHGILIPASHMAEPSFTRPSRFF